jgi:hypothetical protein
MNLPAGDTHDRRSIVNESMVKMVGFFRIGGMFDPILSHIAWFANGLKVKNENCGRGVAGMKSGWNLQTYVPQDLWRAVVWFKRLWIFIGKSAGSICRLVL